MVKVFFVIAAGKTGIVSNISVDDPVKIGYTPGLVKKLGCLQKVFTMI